LIDCAEGKGKARARQGHCDYINIFYWKRTFKFPILRLSPEFINFGFFTDLVIRRLPTNVGIPRMKISEQKLNEIKKQLVEKLNPHREDCEKYKNDSGSKATA